ncbi:MAG: BrnT family toxin [Eubacteriales bacterium]|nr:BrnT family toxin [Eubacteriales bacterium]
MALYFEWDEEKEQISINKHGIDFATASHVFLDPNRMEYYDQAHSLSREDRYITIGYAGDVLTVVYTERRESLRIISARAATKDL